jgi:hypothetical protein
MPPWCPLLRSILNLRGIYCNFERPPEPTKVLLATGLPLVGSVFLSFGLGVDFFMNMLCQIYMLS